ncbi:MAG: hypothetical protein V1685_01050 [Parcubacteria group bacterium]
MPHKSWVGGTVIRTIVSRLGPKVIRKLSRYPGTGQVIGEFRKVLELPGGEAIEQGIREWADRIPAQWRAAINPLLEDFFRPRDKGDEDDDMRPQRTRLPQQREGGQPRTQEPNPFIGRRKVLALTDHLRTAVRGAMYKYGHQIRNLIFGKFSLLDPRELSHFAEDVIVTGTDADLLDMLGMKGDPELKKAGSTTDGKGDFEKGEELLRKLAIADPGTHEKILDVNLDTAFDDEGDELRYYRKLAMLYGDGQEQTVASAIKTLQSIAKRSLEARRHYFGVRVHLGRQIAGRAAGLLERHQPSPDIDGIIAEEEAALAAQVTERKTRWAAYATQQPTVSMAVTP